MFAVLYELEAVLCCELTEVLSCSLPEDAEIVAVIALPDFAEKAMTRHASREGIAQLLAIGWASAEKHFRVGRHDPKCDECPTTMQPSGRRVTVSLTRFLPPFKRA